MKKALIVLIYLLIIASCGSDAPPKTSKVVELPSGKKVRVYSIIKFKFLDKSHEPSFMLRYETSYEIKDSPKLREEVLEVWELLRPIADKAGDSYAMVKANEPIRGAVTKTQSFTYGFVKKEDGSWIMREPKKK